MKLNYIRTRNVCVGCVFLSLGLIMISNDFILSVIGVFNVIAYSDIALRFDENKISLWN